MFAIVPFTPYEWSRVKSTFRSKNEKEVAETVSTTRMWICRMGEGTPVAISCSHLLLRVVQEELKHEKMNEWEKWETIDTLKSLHGHAIVRFVNYINEMGQTSDFYLNMASAVKKFGIPRWIVDIRHAITHQNMPDLYILRDATEFCMAWLWNEFWNKDVSSAIQYERFGRNNKSEDYDANDNRLEEEIRICLSEFKTWRAAHLNNDKLVVMPKLMKMREHLVMDPNGFLQVLVSDGCLIMTPSELRREKITTKNDDDYEIEPRVQTFWDPVFTLVFDQNLGAELTVALLWRLKQQGSLPSSSVNQITAYARMMVRNFANADTFSDRDWSKILEYTLSVPSFFSSGIIELIMAKIPKMSRKRRNQIRRVLNISTSSKVNMDDSLDIKTVEDLRNLLKNEKRVTSSVQAESAAGYKTVDSEEWINIPFGISPGQRLETLSFNVDNESKKRTSSDEVSAGAFPSKKRKVSDRSDIELIDY